MKMMSKISIAIVEDTKRDSDTLISFINRYCSEIGIQNEIKVFPDAMVFLKEYKRVYDIVLMDIELPGINGMAASHSLRELDPDVILIFTTNLTQYAINGYEVNAMDYLLKPIDYYSFSLKLKRAFTLIDRDKHRYYTIYTKSGMRKVATDNIYYIEVMAHQLIWHTKEGNFESRGTMKDVEDDLMSFGFYRCHNAYLINLKHVSELQNDDIVVHNDTLKVSRPRKKAFSEALTKYLGGHL